MRLAPRANGAGPLLSGAAPLNGQVRAAGWAAGAATRLATQREETAGDGRPIRTRTGVRIRLLIRTGRDSGGVAGMGAAGLGDWGSPVQIRPSRPISPQPGPPGGSVVYAPGHERYPSPAGLHGHPDRAERGDAGAAAADAGVRLAAGHRALRMGAGADGGGGLHRLGGRMAGPALRAGEPAGAAARPPGRPAADRLGGDRPGGPGGAAVAGGGPA